MRLFQLKNYIDHSRIRRVYRRQPTNNMKKLIVFLVAFVACFATMAKAQTSLIATLSHEGAMSTFYGSTALQQAHEAAFR